MMLLGISLLLGSFAYADDGSRARNNNSETRKTIHDYFKFPGVLMPHQDAKVHTVQKVEVLFTTDRNGKVNFVLAKTADRQLKAEIEKQFSALFLTKVKEDVVHSVVLNFRSI
jgi:hypothetical protein